ncbi:MAG: hypothetical protein ACLR7Z_19795 [Bilophila wadsworthia]
MARRATVLEGYRREPVPTLTLVGADEFSPDTELPDPAKTGDASPEAVRAVYDALHVDCGMLSAGAAAWFGASRPRNFFEVGDTPVTKRFHVGGVPVAVILFPPLSAGGTPETEAPTPKLLASVLAAADAASDTAIRIGISPWGFEGEFAVREALEQRYHLLLGGGPGAAFAGGSTRRPPASSGRGPTRTGAASWLSTSWPCPSRACPLRGNGASPCRRRKCASPPPSRPIRIWKRWWQGRQPAETAKRAYGNAPSLLGRRVSFRKKF